MTAPPGTAVGFSDVHPVLTLFAEAIAGRSLALEPHEVHPAAEHDGRTIRLPATVDTFASARHNRGAYRLMVLRQIGRLPPDDESALERVLPPSPNPSLLRLVFSTLEDLRVDAAIAHRYPGARADLDRVRRHALAARPTPERPTAQAWLADALARYALGAPRRQLVAADPTGRCARVLDLAAAVEGTDASMHDSAAAAVAIVAALRGPTESTTTHAPVDDAMTMADRPEPHADESGAPAGWVIEGADGEATPADEDLAAGAQDFRGELRADLAYRETGGGIGMVPDDPHAGASSGDTDTGDDQPAAAATPPTGRARRASPPSTDGHGADRTFLYDEWDHANERYLRSWCRVHEQRLRGDDFGFIGDVRRRHAAASSQIRRRFRFLRPEAWHRVHRTDDGDEVEIDAVIEAVVDRRTGHATDERVYLRRDRAQRDVATAFLVDLSASTGSPVDAPVPRPPTTAPTDPDLIEYPYLSPLDVDAGAGAVPPRRAIDVAKDALALMGDAVHGLGDRHAVYGFSGFGRHRVEFFVAKEFDDRPSPRTWAALAAMEPRRYTRMGPAIRHATIKLLAEPVRTKLLIVVSDGHPQDSDYGPEPGDKEYGLQDTARALREAERAGVATYCVTVDPVGNDYLGRMCPPRRYSVIDDVEALPGELAKLYRVLTSPAASSDAAARPFC